jgi:shikimate dehydrogenase
VENVMAIDSDIKAIQDCITNRIDNVAVGDRRVAGVVGSRPSHYSKSPALWNAAFAHLGINAIYLPFDVDGSHLRQLVFAFRHCDRFMGMNVTVPHKLAVMKFLDEMDPGVERIGAVNTVVRTPAGRLIGHNTDGEGFTESVLAPQPGTSQPFVDSLDGIDALLLGAGGSARAVAFQVSDHLAGGTLVISNRTLERAAALVAAIRKTGCKALAIGETEIPKWAPKVGLIINATTKGQGGSYLESYSALAPEQPAGTTASRRENAMPSQTDIKNNNALSFELAMTIPKSVRFYDLIYFPEETVFLRHARLTGHPTMNGKSMIVNQAVIGFFKRICRADLQASAMDNPETCRKILEVMYHAW